MPHRAGTWTLPPGTPGSNARLEELMALLGCDNDIAPLDDKAFGHRAGDLIARAVTTPDRSKRRKRLPAQRKAALRRSKTAH
jgi:hypothetical protein